MSIPILPKIIPTTDMPQGVCSDDLPGKKQPSKSKNATWLKLVLRLGCTIALLAFLLKSVSLPKVLQEVSHLDGGGLFVGLGIGMLGVIISAYQWQCLLLGEQIHIDLKRIVNFYLVGIAFNHFLPTGMGGDVVKAYYVGREGKNAVGATSAVVMSRITGFIGMLLVSLPVLVVAHTLFPRDITLSFLIACFTLCAALIGAFCCVTLLPRFLLGRWATNRLFSLLIKLGQAVRTSVKQPRTMGIAVLFGILFHASAALNYYAYAMVLHIQVPFAFYLVAIPFVSIITFLPLSINGFGLRETAFLYIFTTIHILPATSFLLAILMDVQTLLFGVLGGCIYLCIGMSKGESSYGAKQHG